MNNRYPYSFNPPVDWTPLNHVYSFPNNPGRQAIEDNERQRIENKTFIPQFTTTEEAKATLKRLPMKDQLHLSHCMNDIASDRETWINCVTNPAYQKLTLYKPFGMIENWPELFYFQHRSCSVLFQWKENEQPKIVFIFLPHNE